MHVAKAVFQPYFDDPVSIPALSTLTTVDHNTVQATLTHPASYISTYRMTSQPLVKNGRAGFETSHI